MASDTPSWAAAGHHPHYAAGAAQAFCALSQRQPTLRCGGSAWRLVPSRRVCVSQRLPLHLQEDARVSGTRGLLALVLASTLRAAATHPTSRRRGPPPTARQCLPVKDVLDDIAAGLRSPPHAVVLVAPPGAGKTTLVPLELCGWGCDVVPDGAILVVEPRRMAARAAARRMASMRGEEVGQLVGYRTRFERVVDPQRTRIQVVTDGILVRQAQGEPTLPGVAAVVFDEFHERSVGSDVGLALCLQARSARALAGAPPLRILVMSATLHAGLRERLAALLGGAPLVASEGRAFHVDVRHVASDRYLWRDTKGLETRVAKVVGDALAETTGDVLCFLPGQREIYRSMKAVEKVAPTPRALLEASFKSKKKSRGFGAAPPRKVLKPVDVVPLHGALDAEAQDRAIGPPVPGRRRVVLATNIAEASVTVPGVTAVVDTGLRRHSRFSRALHVDSLETAVICAASADQRAGRAGRVADGVCFRLWGAHQKLAAEDPAPILEVDLSDTVLSLAACGVTPGDIASLPWLDTPPAAAVDAAVVVLKALDALDADGRVTPHGRELARMPLHPRMGHMVSTCEDDTVSSGGSAALCDVAELCALISEERDVVRGRTKTGTKAANSIDIELRLQVLQTGALPDKLAGKLQVAADQRAHCLRVAGDLRRALPRGIGRRGVADVGKLIAAAYPERIARRERAGVFVLRDGTHCAVHDPVLGRVSCLVIAQLRRSQGKPTVATLAAPLSEWEVARAALERSM